MELIIPAAGNASRMRGLPKFLLPCDDDYLTLIEKHINSLISSVDNIWIPTNPKYISILESLFEDIKKVKILPMKSKTMSETVKLTISNLNKSNYMLVMPDTYYTDDQPYQLLISSRVDKVANLICWETRPSQIGKLGEVAFLQDGKLEHIIDKPGEQVYKHAWGAITFTQSLNKYINIDDPHIGYAIEKAHYDNQDIYCFEAKGGYYDCGTPNEYIDLLKKIF